MVPPALLAAIPVLLPGMGILWLYLRRCEGFFEQGRLFFALMVGLLAGIAVRALEVFLISLDQPRTLQADFEPLATGTLVYSFAYTTLGLALIETLGKTV